MPKTPENKSKDNLFRSLGLTTLVVAGTYYLLSITPYADRYKSTTESAVPTATPTPIAVNTERAKRAWIIYTSAGSYPKDSVSPILPSPSPALPK